MLDPRGGERPFHGELVRKTRHNTTREQSVGYFCRATGHGAGEGEEEEEHTAPSGPFAWSYLHRVRSLKGTFLLSSLCAFRVFVFLTPFSRKAKLDERLGSGARKGDCSAIATHPPFAFFILKTR